VKDRTEPLRPVDKPGHLVITLPTKGQHNLRLPTWSTASRIASWWGDRPTGDGSWEYVAALLGVCWAHQTLEIEAVFPIDDPSPANLVRYSDQVQRELDEAGYSSGEADALAEPIIAALKARRGEQGAAQKQADFSAPPTGNSTSP
jgi:hypothetical protein